MAPLSVLLVSNRGPISYRFDDAGVPQPRRGAGGLVSGLLPLVTGTDTTWLACALSDADRVAARDEGGNPTEVDGLRVRLTALDEADQTAALDVICNGTLWYLHHHLFNQPRQPCFDAAWWEAWESYRRINTRIAAEVAAIAPEGAAVLVQDYHLSLLAPALRVTRPDLRLVHFTHTPFAGPEALAVLPPEPRRELLTGLAAHHACGFHTARWRDGFVSSCTANGVQPPAVFVAPLGPDPADLAASADSDACRTARRALDERVGDRRLLVRVDRVELSKNLLRGFDAFAHLLTTRPEWRGEVVFAASCYPSRQRLPDYVAYQRDVTDAVEAINRRWGTASWTPVDYDAHDDYPRSVAALQRYDALLVNPVRDGLNLVAKEGPLLNERYGALVLSTDAGAWEELGEHAFGAHPFDVAGTADALHAALSLGPAARTARARELRAAAGARTPADWLADQLRAAEPVAAPRR